MGKVLSVEDHPAAEKLFVCKVEVAPDEVRQVRFRDCSRDRIAATLWVDEESSKRPKCCSVAELWSRKVKPGRRNRQDDLASSDLSN